MPKPPKVQLPVPFQLIFEPPKVKLAHIGNFQTEWRFVQGHDRYYVVLPRVAGRGVGGRIEPGINGFKEDYLSVAVCGFKNGKPCGNRVEIGRACIEHTNIQKVAAELERTMPLVTELILRHAREQQPLPNGRFAEKERSQHGSSPARMVPVQPEYIQTTRAELDRLERLFEAKEALAGSTFIYQQTAGEPSVEAYLPAREPDAAAPSSALAV